MQLQGRSVLLQEAFIACILCTQLERHVLCYKRDLSMILSENFDRAYLFAAALHRNQKRKNVPSPFMAHLLAVASLVAENCDDEELVMAAILHDAVEDQGGLPTLEKIKEQFGERVASFVLCCTDSTEMPRPPKTERNCMYLQSLQSAPEGAIILSCADKIHNLRSMYADYLLLGPGFWSVFSSPPGDILHNYHKLHKLYQERLPQSRLLLIFEDALRVVEELV